jgi:hypothetical protein
LVELLEGFASLAPYGLGFASHGPYGLVFSSLNNNEEQGLYGILLTWLLTRQVDAKPTLPKC